MRMMFIGMHQNIEALKRHNFSKNHEIESLLHNINDYDPVKIKTTVHNEIKVLRDNRRNMKL